MNIVDIVILICFVPALIRGVSKGFVEQALALVGLVVSIWAAIHYYLPVYEWFKPYIPIEETVLKVSCFGLILIVVIVVANILAKLINRILKFAMLGWLDKLLGIIFAVAIALILIALVIVVMHTVNVRFHLVDSPVFKESVLYNKILDSAYSLFPALKNFLHDAAGAAQDAAEAAVVVAQDAAEGALKVPVGN